MEQASTCLREGRGGGVRVAVLDSGIDRSHPDLTSLQLEDDVVLVQEDLQWRVVPGEGRDVYGHGTAVADIIHRLAPEATLGSFRVLGEQLRSRSLLIREAARLALDRGYHILNCSFGSCREDHVLLFKDWVDEAYVRSRHIVAACNNQDFNRREWPGHFPTVVTVNFAEWPSPEMFRCRAGHLVEFAARGVDVEVAWAGGGRKQVTGSSFAAPHLTGLLARLLSGMPKVTPLQAKALLQALATPGT